MKQASPVPPGVHQNRGNGCALSAVTRFRPVAEEHVQWYNGNCVEVADLGADRIGVRDSKAGAGSPVLQFSLADWTAFLVSVKDGRR